MLNTVQQNDTGGFLGLKERQEREREAVSRSILDAARELFVAEGYNNVSIRKIAERIEYSPAAIYSYFPSKDDIFYALAEEGFRKLFESRADHEPGPDVLDNVRRSFWHLYEFSKQHPEYFALMFVDRSVPRISRDWERFGFVHEMRNKVAARIQRAIDEGVFPKGTDPHWAFMVLVASVQGAAIMRVCDRMAPGANADALARDTLEAALTGLRAGFPATFHPGSCIDKIDE
jgi:AcrR family transcriptional regulator